MKHRVVSVDPNSIADELGVLPGDSLVSINGEKIVDVIDYEGLSTGEQLLLLFESADGEEYEAEVEKELYEPLGLNFETGLMSPMRRCQNRCAFCFIDQMPKGVRDSLHVKDDDWRLSLYMGNYVSLTNVDEAEFQRIIDRRVSPLYVSVHATDPQVRSRLMHNKNAGLILERLTRLKEEGLRFCAQIVLCPEQNDGQILKESLESLMELQPAAMSVAVVPVGLTRFRDGLFPLRPLTKEEAGAAIDEIEALQKKSLRRFGCRFAFPSDEFYLLSERPIPDYASYEDFSQIENGVGLLRQFEQGFHGALLEKKPLERKRVFDSVSGFGAAPFMEELFRDLLPYGIEIRVHPIKNDYFGGNVWITGLLTPTDMLPQLGGKLEGEALLISETTMREKEPVFLDGEDLAGFSKRLGLPVIPMPACDGGEFIEKLFSEELKHV